MWRPSAAVDSHAEQSTAVSSLSCPALSAQAVLETSTVFKTTASRAMQQQAQDLLDVSGWEV